jgi:ABC-2 type transport system ATP-binding protein
MLQFEQVTRVYGSKVAVDGLSFVIPAGQLFAFLGPNGAGKTTTIKMLVGLLRPTIGHVRVGGFDVVRQTREATRLIGYVPDSAFLYEKLSGREFLEFVADARGLSRAERNAAVTRQSQQFGLTDFLDDLTETYSHGMKQRTALAAVMLHDPPVLVIDEPMVGLDPKSTRLVKDLLRQRVAAGGTVFLSTHTLALAEEIADRVGIIDHGHIKFLGTREELQQELTQQGRSLETLFLRLTTDQQEAEPA